MELRDRKDIYLSIAKNADDRTILNMLSVNKKFSDSLFFEQVFKVKYPYLIRFKPKDQSWKQFYLKMIFYLEELKKRGIPYIPSEHYDVKKYYNIITDYEVLNALEGLPVEENHLPIFYLFPYAAQNNDFPFVKHVFDNYEIPEIELKRGMIWSVRKGHLDMVKYFVKQGVTTEFKNSKRWLFHEIKTYRGGEATQEQLDVLKYLNEQIKQ